MKEKVVERLIGYACPECSEVHICSFRWIPMDWDCEEQAIKNAFFEKQVRSYMIQLIISDFVKRHNTLNFDLGRLVEDQGLLRLVRYGKNKPDSNIMECTF